MRTLRVVDMVRFVALAAATTACGASPVVSPQAKTTPAFPPVHTSSGPALAGPLWTATTTETAAHVLRGTALGIDTPFVCRQGDHGHETMPLMDGLEAVLFGDEPADYIRLEVGGSGDSRDKACTSATDVAWCEDVLYTAWKTLAPAPLAPSGPPGRIVLMHGNSLWKVNSGTALRGVLGRVDTAEKAAFVVSLHGYDVRCDVSRALQDGASWLMTAVVSAGCEWSIHVLRVHSGGTLDVLKTEGAGTNHVCPM